MDLSRVSVLLIDSYQPSREALAHWLSAMHASVTDVGDAIQGLGVLITGTRPDVILCDAFLPELDGWAFLRRVRDEPAFAMIPIIGLTSELRLYDPMIKAGFEAVLVKPFLGSQVAATILGALRRGLE